MRKNDVSSLRLLHLDLKGVIPDFNGMLEYLAFWKECGFNGIVLEYENRIPWKCFPNACSAVYTTEEQSAIAARCRELGLELIPLIQSIGHLEWLLKEERYSFLREDRHINELCLSHPETLPLLKRWIDETISLHPGIRHIHLGGDEAWYFGSCERCRERDPSELYFSHMRTLIEYANSRGVDALIWNDTASKRKDVPQKYLPEGTIFCDWVYSGQAPFESTLKLEKTQTPFLGCSALACNSLEKTTLLLGHPLERLENIEGWNKYAESGVCGLLHTAWGRSNSLSPGYGCWSGLVPFAIAAGNPGRWKRHPWHGKIEKVFASVMDQSANKWKIANEVLSFESGCRIEREALKFLNLSLRYQALSDLSVHLENTLESLLAGIRYLGKSPHDLNELSRQTTQLAKELGTWKSDAVSFWRDNAFSNEKEFFATHSAIPEKRVSRMKRKITCVTARFQA